MFQSGKSATRVLIDNHTYVFNNLDNMMNAWMFSMLQMGYKYKLRIHWKTKERLNQWIGANRLLWNLALSQREMIDYKEFKVRAKASGDFESVNYNYQEKELKALKRDFPFFKDLPAQVPQQCLMQLDQAFKRFFKKESDYPKPKKKSKREAGLRFPILKEGAIEWHKKDRRKAWVTLPKIGKLRFVCSRKFEGKVKNVTLSKKGDSYFVSFGVETTFEPTESRSKSAVGIDRGCVRSIALSNGKFFDLPTAKIKNLEQKIARLQKDLASNKKFSNNWKKKNTRINRAHSKIANIRKDFLWKSAHNLAKSHGMIAIEGLGVKRMSKSSRGTVDNPGRNVAQKSGLNRSILRQGWHDFSVKLEWQAKRFDSRVVAVAPHNTSITCSACSHQSNESRVSQELFSCVECGYEDNADTNAAKNILDRAAGLTVLNALKGESPDKNLPL